MLANQLVEATEQLDAVRAELAAQPDVSELEQKFTIAMDEARDLRTRNAELQQQLDESATGNANENHRVALLEAERDSLAAKIATLEQAAPPEIDSQEFDDLRQRFEMAVEEVRTLKAQNSDLTEQLAQRQDNSPVQGWEEQKKQLLRSLSDGDDEFDSEESRQERASIENTIQLTDQIVSEKDREIEELKNLLQHQADNIGDVAVGAEAVAELFDKDEAIHQERQRLEELQSELTQKLREAELEISVERAKTARERTDLDERIRDLECREATIADILSKGDQGAVVDGKPTRKWLTRLGLGGE